MPAANALSSAITVAQLSNRFRPTGSQRRERWQGWQWLRGSSGCWREKAPSRARREMSRIGDECTQNSTIIDICACLIGYTAPMAFRSE